MGRGQNLKYGPDMSSISTALPRIGGPGLGPGMGMGMGYMPSSPMNHARMSPSVLGPGSGPGMGVPRSFAGYRPSSLVPPPPTGHQNQRVQSPTHLQPPVTHRRSHSSGHLRPPPTVDHHRPEPRRSSTIKAVPIEGCCPECCPVRPQSTSQNSRERGVSVSRHGSLHRRETSAVPVSSPLKPVREIPIARKVSGVGGQAKSSPRHCSECSN